VRIVSLGSGSSGNALLVEAGPTRVLVDAGFPPATLRARLRQVGVLPHTLTAILLTHEHHDHARGAMELAGRHAVPLIANGRTLDEVRRASPLPIGVPVPAQHDLAVGESTQIGGLLVSSFPVSHDAVAPCGYTLSSGAWRVCVAIDTGEVTAPMAEALQAAHLLVLEANHDEERLLGGPYPWHLKRRIRSATGHLSNAQAAAALIAALDDGPRWVWLAHLSRTNNTPDLARATVRAHLHQVGLAHARVMVAPPGPGPIWDSATIWSDSLQPPADARPTRTDQLPHTGRIVPTAVSRAPGAGDADHAEAPSER
jgi:phosphoribosyl 1,2-cyclic phosphodiesterase